MLIDVFLDYKNIFNQCEFGSGLAVLIYMCSAEKYNCNFGCENKSQNILAFRILMLRPPEIHAPWVLGYGDKRQ